MARTIGKPAEDTTTEAPATVDSLIPPFPADFKFTVSESIPLPERASPAARSTQHPFGGLFDTRGHNSSFFVPVSYWLTRSTPAHPRTVENTSFAWQKGTIAQVFLNWRAKDKEARGKWRLVTVTRELGADPEFPQFAGIRAFKVDTTR